MCKSRIFACIVGNAVFVSSANPPPSGTCDVLDRILQDTGTEIFKTHKTGTVPRKPGRMGSQRR